MPAVTDSSGRTVVYTAKQKLFKQFTTHKP